METKKSVRVTRITIKIKDKTISLTPEEARDLKAALGEVLGEPISIPTVTLPPIIIERPWRPWRDCWETTGDAREMVVTWTAGNTCVTDGGE